MKIIIPSIILIFTLSMYGQSYVNKTNFIEGFLADDTAKEIAKSANSKLIWHSFPDYKKDDHLHEYYILEENKDEDFLFSQPNYDCFGCLHIEFKPIERKLILYRIAGNYDYVSKIWINYFRADKKANLISNQKHSGKFKFFKEKYSWVIIKV